MQDRARGPEDKIDPGQASERGLGPRSSGLGQWTWAVGLSQSKRMKTRKAKTQIKF